MGATELLQGGGGGGAKWAYGLRRGMSAVNGQCSAVVDQLAGLNTDQKAEMPQEICTDNCVRNVGNYVDTLEILSQAKT